MQVRGKTRRCLQTSPLSAKSSLVRYSIGFDFGTESVRVLFADVRNGHIAAQAVQAYEHGVIDQALPTSGGMSSVSR